MIAIGSAALCVLCASQQFHSRCMPALHLVEHALQTGVCRRSLPNQRFAVQVVDCATLLLQNASLGPALVVFQSGMITEFPSKRKVSLPSDAAQAKL